MISAAFYRFVYLLIVTILTSATVGQYKNRILPTTRANQEIAKLSLLTVLLVLFIGLRPHAYVFVDTMNYVFDYDHMEGSPFVFNPQAKNFIFDNLFLFFASARLGITSFFVLIATIYFGAAAMAVKRIFQNDAYIAFIAFLGAFSTFSYGTNGVKAGAAASLFLLALSYRDKMLPCLMLMFATVGMHHSMKVPVIAFLVTLFLKNPKYYFYGWVFSAVMAIGHVSFFQNLFSSFADESGAAYLVRDGITEYSYMSGFRPDFMLYSAMPVWVGYIAKYKKNIQSKMYDTLLYTYITTNAVWMLCMYASFTNRIAYLSWLLYPVVLIYPFFDEKFGKDRYRMVAKVTMYHLCFTLFMDLIYYGGIMELLG